MTRLAVAVAALAVTAILTIGPSRAVAPAAEAASQPDAEGPVYVELVLDASASMWNRLEDGRYRIAAAKEVLRDFVGGLPDREGLNVGLRIYGSEVHFSEAGACEDTSLFVDLEGLEREALLQTVKEARAVGATPLARSIREAGEDFQEGARNLLVVVTDGVESCGGDLEAAVGSLRREGIEVDLRLIGIDLSEEALASFAGIVEVDNAASATELAAALGRAVEGTLSEPEAVPVTAVVTREGEPVEGATVVFSAGVGGGATRLEPSGEAGLYRATLPAGSYAATIGDETGGGPEEYTDLNVSPGRENRFRFELGEIDVDLAVSTAEVPAGSTIEVSYRGAPGHGEQWISLAPEEAAESDYADWADAAGREGIVELRTPDRTRRLEVRFFHAPEGRPTRLVGRSEPFETLPVSAELRAPEETVAGSTFTVEWEGPDNEDDYITVVAPEASEGEYRGGEGSGYAYTADGSPARLRAPDEPGEWEVRYVTGGDGGILARTPLSVVAAEGSVDAPAAVPAGAYFEVAWAGPDNRDDYLTIVPAGAPAGEYSSGEGSGYAYTADGTPLRLRAPDDPGDYEVRYVTGGEARTLASDPVLVEPVEATLDAPDTVPAGRRFTVRWSGPDHEDDYVTIVPAGAPEGDYGDYAYTADGDPLELQAPDEPGTYEVRYVTGYQARTLASVTLEVSG